MKIDLLHTPEGVRDVYGTECENMYYLRDKFHEMFKSFGFSAIQTPTFEFFDIFGNDIGTIPSKDLYKFFDRDGNTLVLRPDITPSVARCAAKYFNSEDVVKLFYMGNIFINNLSFQGRLKEVTQAGAELLGDSSVDADAEMIAMAVKSLLSVGLVDFQISISHVGFLKSLLKEAKLDEDTTDELYELLKNKNYWGVKELISPLDIPDSLKNLFYIIGNVYNSQDELAGLRDITGEYSEVKNVVDYMIELSDILNCYEVFDHVSFEMGIPENMQYYTGIVFSGYTYGTGLPVISGGRYDKLISYFGKDQSAIGFAFIVDEILLALERQGIEIPTEEKPFVIEYDKADRDDAIKKALRLRKDGVKVSLVRK